MYLKKLFPYLFAAVLISGAAVIINAVATGQISGTITDRDTGAPIIGATVKVIGADLIAATDFDGNYIIRGLEPGRYNLLITHPDHDTVEVVDVIVESDLTALISVPLGKRTAGAGETVTIAVPPAITSADAPADQKVISVEKIGGPPATTVDEILKYQAEATVKPDGEVPIRGGRAGQAELMDFGYPDASPKLNYITPPSHCGSGYYPPSHGGSSIVNGQPYDAMFFENYGANPFVDTQNDHLSTFAIDVDDASYSLARSYLERGHLPAKDAVRVEEFVNHFDYDYHQPRLGEVFSIQIEGAPSRFGQNCQLLKIGIKGRDLDDECRQSANLVFVIDVSGSMGRENRLGLVKRSLELLVNQLLPGDRVGIVTYGSTGQVVLQPTSVHQRHCILSSIQRLFSGGSTYAEEGLRLGYQMADRMYRPDRINRIILCSDGVANVGQTGPDELVRMIKRYADRGITLTTVGFGMGNYNDVLMEKLADNGDGQYAYIDDIDEARRLFVDKLAGTLQVIARDVKIQVDFNPAIVRSYRLLGYENRWVADDKFRDNREDGGEIGSGHQVTALYEVNFERDCPPGDLGAVQVRFKSPDMDEVTEVSAPITRGVFHGRFENASDDFKLAAAAAEFAEIMRESYWARGSSLSDVLAVVNDIGCERHTDQIAELTRLINLAMQHGDALAER